MIISFILITFTFNSRMILWGEIRCQMLLEVRENLCFMADNKEQDWMQHFIGFWLKANVASCLKGITQSTLFFSLFPPSQFCFVSFCHYKSWTNLSTDFVSKLCNICWHGPMRYPHIISPPKNCSVSKYVFTLFIQCSNLLAIPYLWLRNHILPSCHFSWYKSWIA